MVVDSLLGGSCHRRLYIYVLQALYTGLLSTIPQHSNSHAFHKHCQTKTRSQHNIMHALHPPKIHNSEHALPRADRIHLSRLRCEHYTALATYRMKNVNVQHLASNAISVRITITKENIVKIHITNHRIRLI